MNASNRYRNDPQSVAALVEADQVHRDVYVDPEIFELEMVRLWHHAWIYVGHESQVPKSGDYRSIQQGLAADLNPWVSLHRNFKDDEHLSRDQAVNGSSEISMRNQFRAWASMMGDSSK